MAHFRVLTCLLIAALWLVGAMAAAQSSQRCIILHKDVGVIIDSSENERYHVFPGLPEFAYAMVRPGSDSTFEVQIWLRRWGSNPDASITMSRAALLAAAERIEYHDQIVSGTYVLGSNPLRDFAGEEWITMEDPAELPEGSGELLSFELASGTIFRGYLLALYDTALVIQVENSYVPGIIAPLHYLFPRSKIVEIRAVGASSGCVGIFNTGAVIGAVVGVAAGVISSNILRHRPGFHDEWGALQDVSSGLRVGLVGCLIGGVIHLATESGPAFHKMDDDEYQQLKRYIRRPRGGLESLGPPFIPPDQP